jgi:hypothetical protein
LPSRGAPRFFRGLVRHLDRLAEMRDRFLEGGAAQRLVASLTPPFNGGIGQAGLSKVMRKHFGLRRRLVGEAVAQSLSDAAMQDLAPALQEILVSCVLNERMLEAVIAFGQHAFHQHDVGASSGASSMPATACNSL